ncbi:alpha/beta fold hydrolase [Pseudoscardovia radai]|uniref:alpha/beta fold hydrolase n=1 Tax=Pseudoscardovia radai TaxID=987066 RepID=UPI003992BF8B
MVTLIDENDYANAMQGTVIPALAACATEGWMEPATHPGLTVLGKPYESHDGKLHYLTYSYAKFPTADREADAPDEARGTIVIAHGFTEFCQRYDEIAYYFLAHGYSVAIMEDRGHGYSPRDLEDFDRVWIDDWRRYVVDLKKFCEAVARPLEPGRPLCMYAHSMGGGIAVALAEQYPTTLDALVLSAPMIDAVFGPPEKITPAIIDTLCLGHGDQAPAPGQTTFPSWSEDLVTPGLSMARGKWLYDLRADDAHYQNFEATNGWVREMIRLSKSIRRQSAIGRITTPILLLQSAEDVEVVLPAQDKFVLDVREAGDVASLVRLEDAPHEQGSLPNVLLKEVMRESLSFFDTYTEPAPWETRNDIAEIDDAEIDDAQK